VDSSANSALQRICSRRGTTTRAIRTRWTPWTRADPQDLEDPRDPVDLQDLEGRLLTFHKIIGVRVLVARRGEDWRVYAAHVVDGDEKETYVSSLMLG
jgi:hypothetical protein